MTTWLSAIICTHNPRLDYLQMTLSSIRTQHKFDSGKWELIVVDNASTRAIAGQIDLTWHPSARVIEEPKLGLTHARLAGFRAAAGNILVYIDDDNVLDPSYFRHTLAAFEANPKLGAAGGKSIPKFEVEPPVWFRELGINLACRDLGEASICASSEDEPSYPPCAPIGAGMVIRRAAFAGYAEAAERDGVRVSLDRRGRDLASGGDNDIVLSVLAAGWRVAYLPELKLEHLIPASRLTHHYLARYAYSTNKTWVQVLDAHGIRPWQRVSGWTLPFRKLKSFVALEAWRRPANFIRWRGACGIFDGRATLVAEPLIQGAASEIRGPSREAL